MPPRSLLAAAAAVLVAAAGWTLLSSPRSAAGQPRPAVRPAPDPRFDALVQRYFDASLDQSPVRATWMGVHRHDHRLDDLSAEGQARAATALRELQKELEALSPARLSPSRRIDARLLRLRLAADLLELDEIQPWRHNPMVYNEVVSSGLYELVAKGFAPLDERLRSLLARQRDLPRLLADARKNLDNPPEIYTRRAIDLTQGTVKFLRDAVPKVAAGTRDAALLAEVRASNGTAIRALEDFVRWMRRDLLPRSRGRFALGAERFRRKLAAEEAVELDPARLEQIGLRELARTRAALEALGGKATLAKLARDHGGPADLLPDTGRTLEELRRFVVDRRLVSLPGDARCQLVAMPEFMWGFAAMNTPGPFETRAREAYYYVDTVKPGWPEKKRRAHLEAFNRTFLKIVSIHEAYPGHFVQALHARRAPSLMRQLASGSTLIEGWAHYTEQMVLDEGYGKGDPLLRAAQLREALLRLGRYVAAIRLHAGNATVAEVEQLFQREALSDAYTAKREAERGTHDPMYLVYSLGKLQILKLRDDFQRRHPGQPLSAFHDALLAQGGAPVAVIRSILLGDDAGPSL